MRHIIAWALAVVVLVARAVIQSARANLGQVALAKQVILRGKLFGTPPEVVVEPITVKAARVARAVRSPVWEVPVVIATAIQTSHLAAMARMVLAAAAAVVPVRLHPQVTRVVSVVRAWSLSASR